MVDAAMPQAGRGRAGRELGASGAKSASRSRNRIVTALVLLTGLAAIIGLVEWQDIEEVATIAKQLGWNVFWLPGLFVIPMFVAALAWRPLFPPGRVPATATLFEAVWIGASVNSLLPVARIGGEVVRIRLVAGRGTSLNEASASVILDKTVRALAVLTEGLVATALLPVLGADRPIIYAAFAIWVLLATVIAGLVIVQRLGMFKTVVKGVAAAFGSRSLDKLMDRAGRLDQAIALLYRNPRRIVRSWLLKLGFQYALIVELMIIAALIGQPISMLDALMIEGLSAVVRGAAFLMPSTLGIQEASYILLGAVSGLDPALMLVLSLAKRARQVLVGIPGLVLWPIADGRSLMARQRNSSPPARGLERFPAEPIYSHQIDS